MISNRFGRANNPYMNHHNNPTIYSLILKQTICKVGDVPAAFF